MRFSSGAVAQGTSNANIFTLTNPINGYTINFIGTGFTYNGAVPTGGTIQEVTLVKWRRCPSSEGFVDHRQR